MAQKMPRFLQDMEPKKRQYVFFGGAVLIVITIYLMINQMLVGFQPAEPDAQAAAAAGSTSKTLTHRPGQQISDRENWIGGAARDLESLKRQTQESGRRQDQFNRELLSRLEQIERNRTRPEVPTAPPAPVAPPPAVPAQPAVTPRVPPPQAYPPRPNTYPPGVPNAPQTAGTDVAHAPVSVGMVRVSLRQDTGQDPTKVQTRNGAAAGTEQRKEVPRIGTTLPISFVRATMLSGVDAPTGATAQRHPLPVLMRLDDLAVLPNSFRSDIKDCFALGEATGSLSSERGYIRVIRLSCITVRGEIVEVDVSGAVHGPDGKVGIRGRLVTKQGALLGKALLAGLAGGIAQGFSAQNVTYSVSPLGATYALDPNQVLQSGAYSGVSQAMNELARFYTASAKEMYPIIEIDAGTSVDIVITQKVNFAAALPTSADADGAIPGRGLDRSALVRQINALSDEEK